MALFVKILTWLQMVSALNIKILSKHPEAEADTINKLINRPQPELSELTLVSNH